MTSLDERSAAGALLGAACGDALGSLTEGLTPSAVRARFRGRVHDVPDGVWLTSGDTAVMTLVAESLVEHPTLDLTDVARRLMAWADSAPPERRPSRTLLRAVRNLRSGVPPTRSGLPSTCGGAITRVLPAAFRFGTDDVLRDGAAEALMGVTHADPAARAAGAAVALAVVLSSLGTPPAELPDALAEATRSSDLATRLRGVEACASFDAAAAFNCLGRSDSLLDVLPTALYCTISHPDSCRDAILMAVNEGGPAATTASLAGAILGARLGCACLPPSWLTAVDVSEHLAALARTLASAASKEAP